MQSPPVRHQLRIQIFLFGIPFPSLLFFCYLKIEIQEPNSHFFLTLSFLLTKNMKFSSYPTSSSSSSISSFDANMCNSKSATSGCLAGVLRRILCSGSLPTHPAENIKEADSVGCDKDLELNVKEKIEATATPGIVARLMGLESMPDFDLMKAQKNHNSIARSRSMNSVDYLAKCDEMQAQHRRVKSTLSFREMPTFLELENEEFLILSFENGSRSKESRSNGSKWRKETRPERVPEIKNKENQDTNKVSNFCDKSAQKVGNDNKVKNSRKNKNSSVKKHVAPEEAKRSAPMNHKQVKNEAKLGKYKKKCAAANKVGPESTSENSSPVSVLDCVQFLGDLEVPISEEESRSADSNPRKKLSPELENYENPSPRSDNTLTGACSESAIIEGKYLRSSNKYYQKQDYSELWGDICKLTEAEIVKSEWTLTKIWRVEDSEDIGADFELQIFNQLLDELLDQLC